nr:uncharacterized protein LOC111417855 [Onthophagus taurus]
MEKDSSFEWPTYPFTYEEDSKAVDDKINTLTPLVDDFTGSKASNNYKKLDSRLTHLLDRATRIKPTTKAEQDNKSKLISTIVSLISLLEVKGKAHTSTPTKSVAELSLMAGNSSSGEETSDSTDDAKEVMCMKPIPVTKWGTKFTGEPTCSLSAFLERVKELSVARRVFRNALFLSAIDLFEGKALIWYRANRDSFTSWEELVERLSQEFQPVDYDRLLEEVRKTTQASSETIGIYIATMKNLFSRMNGKISETVQLKIIMKNLTPSLQRQLSLVEVTSIEGLLQLGRKIEATRISADKYVPPPKRCHALEPDLAFVGQGSGEPPSARPEQHQSTKNKCWNCGHNGHNSRQCRNPRKRHCYGCGKPDVVRSSCPRCSGNGSRVCRPYLEVSILGRGIVGLLDSGATNTILGGPGIKILNRLSYVIEKCDFTCRLANGEECMVTGRASIPVTLENRVRIIEVLLIPSLKHTLILGTNFWKRMGIVPDLRNGNWSFSKEPPLVTVNSICARSALQPEAERKLQALIERLFEVFPDQVLGKATSVEHKIIANGPPIKQRYYPVSPAIQTIIDKELDEMLSLDVIKKSNSPWASPILLVPKKEGGYRFCVDYRKLNRVTQLDAYPLPQISWTLDRLRDAKYLSSLDIKSAYWQIPVEEEIRKYTAFTVPNRGLFQFKRMPFDLDPYVFVYLDDIVIVTPTLERHLEILEEVITRIRNAGLTFSKDKCSFCRESLKYLGYVVDRNGLRVDPDKVRAILEIPLPRKVSEVRRMVGVASWYRHFVSNFSTIISPLTSLLRKNQKFVWSDRCEKSLKKVKENLIIAPVLSCPDFTQEFTIQTDASDFGLGAVLSQNLNGEEKNPSGRLARWAIRLQQFNFTIVHRKGKDHLVPDMLSRSVPVIVESLEAPMKSDPWYEKIIKSVQENPQKFNNYRLENGRLYKHIWDKGCIGPKLRADVQRYVQRFQMCQKSKPEQQRQPGKISSHVKAVRPWQYVSVDILGPLPRSGRGYAYILVVLDLFSKFPLAFALR